MSVRLNTPVFLSGNGHFEDMTGVVVDLDLTYRQVDVRWDHPSMAHGGPLTYAAEDLIATADRDGRVWMILTI